MNILDFELHVGLRAQRLGVHALEQPTIRTAGVTLAEAERRSPSRSMVAGLTHRDVDVEKRLAGRVRPDGDEEQASLSGMR